jgi:hypothetical protein
MPNACYKRLVDMMGFLLIGELLFTLEESFIVHFFKHKVRKNRKNPYNGPTAQ